jgi:AraC-like DNA-binding protein
LLRITRYQRALSLRRQNARLSWSAIAVRAGYFDQAHLIHESRDIAGCTPNVLLGSDGGLTDVFLAE